MQTFLPYVGEAEDSYAYFEECAGLLDPKRLGKQRVENLQIMQALLGKRLVTSETLRPGKRIYLTKDQWRIEPLNNSGWTNHPAVRMWRGYEFSLLSYQRAICEEWIHDLGFKDTCFEKTAYLYFKSVKHLDDGAAPPWLGDEAFHISHQSNLIRKDPKYYGIRFPGVPDDLPYIWPI